MSGFSPNYPRSFHHPGRWPSSGGTLTDANFLTYDLVAGQLESAGMPPATLECGLMFKVASWNLNSVRSRLTHVTTWLQAREPDVLLLQELKGAEFPFEAFKALGYERCGDAEGL